MSTLRSKRWDGRICALVLTESGKELSKGDHVSTRREPEAYTILEGGSAPHKSNSTGRVYVRIEGFFHEYFPGVIGAEWVPVTERVHDECGEVVRPDDPEEPKWFCDSCQMTVHTEDTTEV